MFTLKRLTLAASAAAIALMLAPAGAQETLKIGTEGAYPPFNNLNAQGELEGFDIDIAKALCEEMKVTCEFVTQDWDGIIPALQAGKFDAIIASMSITDERKQKVDFAGPYLLAHQDLLVKKDSDITKATDLNDKKLCSVAGSTSAQNVKKDFAPKAQLDQRGGYSECLSALQSGAVDALTTDDSILAGYAAQEQYKGQFKLAGLKLSNENYGVGVKKGDTATLDKVNAALEKMVKDGAWQKAVEENFGPANYKNEPAPKIGQIVQ